MEGIEGEYPVSERGRKSRSVDFPVRSIVRTPTCTQFAARLCERSFLRTGKSALRPPSLRSCEKIEKTHRKRYKRDWESTTCESESRKFLIFSHLLTGYEGDGMLGSFLLSFLRLGALLC